MVTNFEVKLYVLFKTLLEWVEHSVLQVNNTMKIMCPEWNN